MGNSDNTPNDGKLSLDTSAPLWSAILTEVSKGKKIADFKAPAESRPPRSTPSPGSARSLHDQEDHRVLHGGDRSRPRRRRSGSAPPSTRHRAAVAGRLPGTQGHQGLLQPVRGRVPTSRRGRRRTRPGAPGRPRAREYGDPKGTRTAYFYNGSFAPFGRTWGAPFAPTSALPALRAADILRSVRVPDPGPCRSGTALHPATDRCRWRRRRRRRRRVPVPDTAATADPLSG